MKCLEYLASCRLYLLLATIILLLSGCEADELTDEPLVSETDIYFSSNRSGNFEIYRLNGSELIQLTNDASFDSWWPRQSPNGSTMLFYRSSVDDRPAVGGHNNNYAHAALWSLDIVSGTLAEVIPEGGNGWAAQGVVDYSPDGTQLIMAAIEPVSNRWHLYVTDTTGRNPVKITNRSSLFADPSWSPDGTQITYTAFPPDYAGFDLANLEIYIANADGSNEQRLTNDDIRDHDPYWSPDGRTIAFESAVDPAYLTVGKWALRAVDPLNAAVKTIFDDGNINTVPRWSADGNTLFFHRFIFGSGHGFILSSIDADGGNYQAMTSGGNYDDTDVDWYRVDAR